MRYLLDTNIVSDLVRNPQGRAAEHIRKVGEVSVCTSIIVAAELRYGAAKKGSLRLARQLEVVLGALDVLPFCCARRSRLRRDPHPARTDRKTDRRQRSTDCRSDQSTRLYDRHRQRKRVRTDRRSSSRELASVRLGSSNLRHSGWKHSSDSSSSTPISREYPATSAAPPVLRKRLPPPEGRCRNRRISLKRYARPRNRTSARST